MKKQVNFSPKPKNPDEWISEGSTFGHHDLEYKKTEPKQDPTQKIKRITIDIPQNWHSEIKVFCAKKGVKMNEEILPILQKHFSLKP